MTMPEPAPVDEDSADAKPPTPEQPLKGSPPNTAGLLGWVKEHGQIFTFICAAAAIPIGGFVWIGDKFADVR